MVPSVEVWLDGRDASPVGTARFNLRRGAVSTSFQYDPSYAASPDAFAMDPALPLGSGAFHAAGTFGCMRDSAPDRWGRRLIEKRLRAEGRFGADSFAQMVKCRLTVSRPRPRQPPLPAHRDQDRRHRARLRAGQLLGHEPL